ncbi:MAG: restriction endonuclease subunit S [Phocaeicola sp.]|uniref:restriction endonuclease subunit S n=1 Tax=Phocaeicola sp. TaxID=2773926 RepID=UPI003FA0E955
MGSYAKRFDANKVVVLDNGKYPYVVRMSSNNGQKGYIVEDEQYLNEGNTISFGQDTATVYYQEKPYFTGDKIKILKAKKNWFCKDNALFFLTAIAKSFSGFSWGSSSFSVDIIEQQKISLPITSKKEINFDFIELFIAELEERSVAELEAWLRAAELENCELTDEEKNAMEEVGKLHLCEFRIGDLMDKVELKKLNKNFDKKKDLSSQPDTEHPIPITNAKFGDNGIMFWAKKGDFETTTMSIDIVQNGAVATGKVYPQPQETAVLWDSYLVKLKEQTATPEILYFLATAMEKVLYTKYSYEYKAYWDKVKDDNIILPATNGSPDYHAMTTLISAVKKLVVRDVTIYTKQKVGAAKQVAGR